MNKNLTITRASRLGLAAAAVAVAAGSMLGAGVAPAHAGPTLGCIPAPSITIHDEAGWELNGSVVPTVSLSKKACWLVKVHFATNDGTAKKSAGDYPGTSGDLVFQPGTTHLQLPVTIFDDGLGDSGETFSVNLSGPSGATIADSVGIMTILEGEPPTPG